MRTLGGPRTQGIPPYHTEMVCALRLAPSTAHSHSKHQGSRSERLQHPARRDPFGPLVSVTGNSRDFTHRFPYHGQHKSMQWQVRLSRNLCHLVQLNSRHHDYYLIPLGVVSPLGGLPGSQDREYGDLKK